MDTPSNTGPADGKKAFPGTHPNSLKKLKKPWQPGQAGNPAGRPKGERTIRNILNETLPLYIDVEKLKHLQGSMRRWSSATSSARQRTTCRMTSL